MYYNPIIVIPFAVWAIVQIIKFVNGSLRGEINFNLLYASGGMPSAHSAAVAALATTALLLDGPTSHLFGFAAVFAAIVMYDSLGARRATGDQAVAINMMLVGLTRDKIKLDQPDLKLREVLGHKPIEVVVGAVFGVVLAGLFNLDRLGWLTTWLMDVPGRLESYAYFGSAVTFIIVGLAIRMILPWRKPKSQSMKKFAKLIFVWLELVGGLGLILWFAVYEHVSYLAWRAWWVVTAALAMAAAARIIWFLTRKLPSAREAELAHERRSKWLNWGRKNKRK